MHPFPSFSRFLNRGKRMRNTTNCVDYPVFDAPEPGRPPRRWWTDHCLWGGLTDSTVTASSTANAAPCCLSSRCLVSLRVPDQPGATHRFRAGSGFQAGATATVDGVQRSVSVQGSTTIRFSTPAHGAGQVDVLVTNPDGQAARLAGAYTYVPQSRSTSTASGLVMPWRSGSEHAIHHFPWGHGNAIHHRQREVGRCDVRHDFGFGVVPSAVGDNGQFSFVEGENVVISGRIVSARGAVGGINTGPCPATRWVATSSRAL